MTQRPTYERRKWTEDELLADGVMYVEDVRDMGAQCEVTVRRFPPPGSRDEVRVGMLLWQNGTAWDLLDAAGPNKLYLRLEVPDGWVPREYKRRLPVVGESISL